MTEIQVITSSEQGFAVTGLRSSKAELLMVPELGGRIISLKSLQTGREWLWHQPRPDWLWANQPGDNFGLSTQAGIDECVPSVAGCTFKGRAIPDHGEVWYQAWRLDPEALKAKILKATVKLDVSPLVFSRAIRVAEDGAFVFDYSLENTGTEAEPYIWCFHPLKNIEPGDRLEFPAGVSSLRLDGGLGAPIQRGDVWAYPEPFPGIRLDECITPGMPGEVCVKGFAGPLKEGRAALVNDRTGDRLELSWDADLVPYMGFWLNRGLCNFHHVALEPATGIPDSLALAVEDWKEIRSVQPGETVKWSLVMRLS